MRSAEHRGQRLHGDADDVVERLLRLERHAASLRVEPETRTRVARAEALAHETRVHAARGAELGRLLEEVVVRREEERQAWGEGVDAQPRVNCRFYILHGVRERERQLLHCRGASLANVVAGDRDRIPVGQLGGREAERVRDQRQ